MFLTKLRKTVKVEGMKNKNEKSPKV